MKSGKVLLGILAGVATGALLGILFAPAKGSKTRRNILNKGENYADDLKDKYDEVVDIVQKKYENTLHQAEDMVAKGKAKYDEAKNLVKNETA